MVAIRVPCDVAVMLESIDSPGNSHAASDMHITVLYLGDDVSVPRIGMAMVAAQEVAAKTVPFLLSTSGVTSFNQNDEGSVPVIAPIDSPQLHAFQEALRASMDKHGVWYSDKYPVYKPHVTLSYAEGVKANGSFQNPLSWGAYGVDIYGGNEGMEGVFVHIPFGLPDTFLTVKMAAMAMRMSNRPIARR